MSLERGKANKLSNRDFKFLCQFAYDSAGIVLNESKREMLYRRLARILRERKLPTFSAYCQLLRESPEQESKYFINAITTNLTSFFREKHHFDFLSQKKEIQRMVEANHQERRLRFWSSACSTGEEAYSLAMTLQEALVSYLGAWDVKILATDIDSNVLAKAKKGVYEISSLADVPVHLKQKYFQRGVGDNASKIKANQQLQRMITFKRLNLLHEWPIKGPFDVIFCRNVIIYFDKQTQEELFSRYYDMLRPGGLLILGHSENLGEHQAYFENIGKTIFRKPLLHDALEEGDIQ